MTASQTSNKDPKDPFFNPRWPKNSLGEDTWSPLGSGQHCHGIAVMRILLFLETSITSAIMELKLLSMTSLFYSAATILAQWQDLHHEGNSRSSLGEESGCVRSLLASLVVADKQLVQHLQKEVTRLKAELLCPEPSSSKFVRSLLLEKEQKIQQTFAYMVTSLSHCLTDFLFRLLRVVFVKNPDVLLLTSNWCSICKRKSQDSQSRIPESGAFFL